MPSIQRMCLLERTTSRYLHDAIHMQYGGFSMDQGERANFEGFLAIYHLQVLSVLPISDANVKNILTFRFVLVAC